MAYKIKSKKRKLKKEEGVYPIPKFRKDVAGMSTFTGELVNDNGEVIGEWDFERQEAIYY